MTIAKLMVLCALAGSIVLFAQAPVRVFATIALVAAALQTLFMFGLLSISMKGVNVLLLLAIALLVCGTLVWIRTVSRPTVTAATIVTFVGALQVIDALL
jgi:hypothetical protein